MPIANRLAPIVRAHALVLCAVLLLGGPTLAKESATHPARPEICVADLERRLAHLASDEMCGRESLSKECVAAATYIAEHFARIGLVPKGTEGWFQPYAIRQPVLGEGNALETTIDGATRTWQVEKDWNPFAVSKAAAVEGDVVFAGYGIQAPRRDWDDYAGVDVKSKVVLVFRKNPGWRERQHASFLKKLDVAAKAGAAAVLLMNDPETVRAAGRDAIGHWTAGVGAPAGSGRIPYLFVSHEVGKTLLGAAGADLDALEKEIRAKGPASRPLPGARVRLDVRLSSTSEANTQNVVGFLPGQDPEVAEEVVVLGAHYDHVGTGLFGSTGGKDARGKIHNGADDNASGTSALIELAEHFAAPGNRTRRSLLFVAFSGEERGLLGSLHHVANPAVPLADMVAMVNMDMVGRSRDGRLQVGGVGTAKGLQALVAAQNEATGLRIDWDPQGNAPSDSTSFFRKRIPVLFFFTGLHKDYHRPTDDIEHINFPDMLRIVRLVEGVTRDIANRDERLQFTMPPPRPRPPVLGIQPSPEPDPDGVAVLRVTPDGPAAKAGMQDGDVIVELGGRPVKDLRALRQVLGRLEGGKRVPVVVLRGEERIPLQVTLQARAPARRR